MLLRSTFAIAVDAAKLDFEDGVSQAPPGYLLFIAVNTAPGNVPQRAEIRQSWGQSHYIVGPNPNIQYKFAVGWPEPFSSDAKALEQDNATHGDFLRLPIREGYHNLVNKTIAMMRWFALEGNARYIMKLDDDSFPNFNRLVPLLQLKTENGKRYTYAGDMMLHHHPLLWGKWRQDPAVYNESDYPPYATGPGYLMGADLACLIYSEHYSLHIGMRLDNEDVNTGVWVHREHVTGTQIDYTNLEAEEEGCQVGVYIAMNLPLGQMPCMWKRKLAGERDFCCAHSHSTWADRNAVGFLRQAVAAQRRLAKGWVAEQDRHFALSLASQSLAQFGEE